MTSKPPPHTKHPNIAIRVIAKAKKITLPEYLVLRALCRAHGGAFDGFGYVSFAYLSKRTKQPRKAVRRACRSLARKGLAEYARGLFNEDGEVAGAGYSNTTEGSAVYKMLGSKWKPK